MGRRTEHRVSLAKDRRLEVAAIHYSPTRRWARWCLALDSVDTGWPLPLCGDKFRGLDRRVRVMPPIDRQATFSGTKDVAGALAFDAARLEAYLAARLPDFAGPLRVRQFKGGQSNPTTSWRRRRAAMCCGASHPVSCCRRRTQSIASSASSPRCTRKASRWPRQCSPAPTMASSARRSMSWLTSRAAWSGSRTCRTRRRPSARRYLFSGLRLEVARHRGRAHLRAHHRPHA